MPADRVARCALPVKKEKRKKGGCWEDLAFDIQYEKTLYLNGYGATNTKIYCQLYFILKGENFFLPCLKCRLQN